MIRENGEKLKSFKYLEQPCTTEISVEQVDFISNNNNRRRWSNSARLRPGAAV